MFGIVLNTTHGTWQISTFFFSFSSSAQISFDLMLPSTSLSHSHPVTCKLHCRTTTTLTTFPRRSLWNDIFFNFWIRTCNEPSFTLGKQLSARLLFIVMILEMILHWAHTRWQLSRSGWVCRVSSVEYGWSRFLSINYTRCDSRDELERLEHFFFSSLTSFLILTNNFQFIKSVVVLFSGVAVCAA